MCPNMKTLNILKNISKHLTNSAFVPLATEASSLSYSAGHIQKKICRHNFLFETCHMSIAHKYCLIR